MDSTIDQNISTNQKIDVPSSDDTIDKLSDQLAQVPLKQKRLLSEDTHAYEHFELPVTRVSILLSWRFHSILIRFFLKKHFFCIYTNLPITYDSC